MILRRTAIAMSTLALALSVGSTGSAQAAAPAIHTMAEVTHIKLTGSATAAGYTYDTVAHATARLSPGFAQRTSYKTTETGKAPKSGREVVVKGIEYTNSGKGWKHHKLSKSTLEVYHQHADPALILRVMKGMPGLKHLSAHHYRAVGSLHDLGPYLEWELLYPAKVLKDRQIDTLTVDMSTDSAGRLTEITYSGDSTVAQFRATDSFGRFNKPVKITAPH